MKNFRRYIRLIASIQLLVFLFTLVPLEGLASGPTSPEYTSFEPMEAVDMVNLATGDFVYNKAVMEVPGTGPSFPITMSYHAGIMPEQEASWVGLGWTLNPGSITRKTVGYPDDWKEVDEATAQAWDGGETTQYGLTINIPLTLDGGVVGPSVIVGASYAKDTYRGSAWGYSLGLGVGANLPGADMLGINASVVYSHNRITGSGINIGGGVGVSSPIGDSNFNAFGGLGGGASFSNTGNMHVGGGVNAGIGYSNKATKSSLDKASLGISYSKDGLGGSASVGGVLGGGIGIPKFHLNKSGKITNDTKSFNAMGFSYYRNRYNIDEKENTIVNGAIYPSNGNQPVSYYDSHSFDTYDVFEIQDANNTVDIENIPQYNLGNEMMLGGTLPAYDAYNVTGYGISGIMEPANYLQQLRRKNKLNHEENGKYKVKQYVSTAGLPDEGATERTEFAFASNLVNKYIYDSDNSRWFGTPVSGNPLSYGFVNSEISSELTSGISVNHNEVPKADYVKWFKNSEIGSTSSGYRFMNGVPATFNRSQLDPNQIGGFLVVNASGMSYHYSLPAYNLSEEEHIINVHSLAPNPEDPSKWIKSTVKRHHPYAYIWHLTGISGPDYVDANNDGQMNDGDWGYWVRFEYGLWNDQYKWRSPETGYYESYDGNFKQFSKGSKEVYYLNKIVTTTHTALFVKDIRNDSHGLSDMESNGGHGDQFMPTACAKYPAALLKLSEIVLLRNEDIANLSYSTNNSYPANIPGCSVLNPNKGVNVLLSENITSTQWTQIRSRQLKCVKFTTDYSLMPGVPSSFSNVDLYKSNPTNNQTRTGRLTLKSMAQHGKNDLSLIPSEKYTYKNPSVPYKRDAFDFWGYYKSDFNPNMKDINLKRMPTATSAANIDTWSLVQVQHSLGNQTRVAYSADTHKDPVLLSRANMSIANMTSVGSTGEFSLQLNGMNSTYLNNLFEVNSVVSLSVIIAEAWEDKYDRGNLCDDVYQFRMLEPKYYFNDYIVKYVGSNSIRVQPIIVNGENYINHALPYKVETSRQRNNDPNFNCGGLCITNGGWTKDYKDFIGGEIYFNVKDFQLGGGLKVDRISSIGLDGTEERYNYEYTGISGATSGVTPYVPVGLNEFSIADYPTHYRESNGWYKQNEFCNGSIFKALAEAWGTLYLVNSITGPQAFVRAVLEHKDAATGQELLIRLMQHYGLTNSAQILLPLNLDYINFKRKQINQEVLAKQNFVPPGVIYGRVKSFRTIVDTQGIERTMGYKVHEFQTFEEGMVEIKSSHSKNVSSNSSDPQGINYRKTKRRGVQINLLGNSVGSLKKVTTFNDLGDKLVEITNVSLYDLVSGQTNLTQAYQSELASRYNSQGRYDRVFVNGRFVPWKVEYLSNGTENYFYDLLGVTTKWSYYPDVPISTVTADYVSGNKSIIRNIKFNNYTGIPNIIYTKTDGSLPIVSRSMHAYELLNGSVSSYGSMGLKYHNASTNKNMITQEGLSMTFAVQETFNPDTDLDFTDNVTGLFGASLQTWSDRLPVLASGIINQTGIFRKDATFSYIGSGETPNQNGILPVNYSQLVSLNLNLNGNNAPTSSGWQKNGNVTLYDRNSNPIEVMDINSNYAATRFDAKSERVLATAANARYGDFTYSGFENPGDGNMVITGQNTGLTFAPTHTGLRSLVIEAGGKSYYEVINSNEFRGGKYRIAYWTHQLGAPVGVYYQVNGGSEQTIASEQVGSVVNNGTTWHLRYAYVDLPGSFNSLRVGVKYAGSKAWIDDFRFQPIDAVSTAYAYNTWGELSEVLDNNNLFTRYEYDEMGRLKRVFTETLTHGVVKVSESTVNYALQN